MPDCSVWDLIGKNKATLQAQQEQTDTARARAIVYADARRDGFRDWLPSGEAFGVVSPTSTITLDLNSPMKVIKIHPASKSRSDTVLASLEGALRSPTFVISKNKIHIRALPGNGVRVNLVLNGLRLIQEPDLWPILPTW